MIANKFRQVALGSAAEPILASNCVFFFLCKCLTNQVLFELRNVLALLIAAIFLKTVLVFVNCQKSRLNF